MSKLEEKFSRNPPVTFDDILHFIKERFDIQLMIKTLYNLIGRIPQLKSYIGIPMDIYMIDKECLY